MKLTRRRLMLILLAHALALTGGATSGSAATPPGSPELSCVEAGSIDAQVTAAAEVVGLDCSFKEYKGVKSLHFDVTLKNVSNADQRYRVNLFLDNGKAVGGLIPRKTKKGLVQPGQTASFVYPVKDMTKEPKGITLNVRTMSK